MNSLFDSFNSHEIFQSKFTNIAHVKMKKRRRRIKKDYDEFCFFWIDIYRREKHVFEFKHETVMNVAMSFIQAIIIIEYHDNDCETWIDFSQKDFLNTFMNEMWKRIVNQLNTIQKQRNNDVSTRFFALKIRKNDIFLFQRLNILIVNNYWIA